MSHVFCLFFSVETMAGDTLEVVQGATRQNGSLGGRSRAHPRGVALTPDLILESLPVLVPPHVKDPRLSLMTGTSRGPGHRRGHPPQSVRGQSLPWLATEVLSSTEIHTLLSFTFIIPREVDSSEPVNFALCT